MLIVERERTFVDEGVRLGSKWCDHATLAANTLSLPVSENVCIVDTDGQMCR